MQQVGKQKGCKNKEVTVPSVMGNYDVCTHIFS